MEVEQPAPQEATPPCHLWRMPQEIIDMIIDMAFGHKSEDGIKTIRAWNEEEVRRKKHGGHEYKMRPFKPKVDDFMVSKAFFALAAKAWFSEQTWEDGPTFKSSFFRGRLFYEYGAYVFRPADSRLEGIVSCPRLHTAHIDVTPDHFDELIMHEGAPASEPKLPWLDTLDEGDFEKLRITAALKKASGLRSFSLRETACYFPKNDQERALWRTNMSALETYLRPFVTSPKRVPEDDYPKDRPRPLYAGSRVCWNTSELLPEDFWKDRSRNGGPFQVTARYRTLEDRQEKAKEVSGVFLERMIKLGMDPEELLRLAMKAKKEEEQAKESSMTPENECATEPASSAAHERQCAPSTPPPQEASGSENRECGPSPSTVGESTNQINETEVVKDQSVTENSLDEGGGVCLPEKCDEGLEQASKALQVALAA